MKEENPRNIAVTLLFITAILLFLSQGGQVKWQSQFAILVLILLSFGLPWLGLIFAVPVFFIVAKSNQAAISAFWNRLKNIQITNI